MTDPTTPAGSADQRAENDLDPLSKGEPNIAASPSPESQDGGRTGGAPEALTDASLADGESLEEPGAGSLEGTAS